ncbi:MAG: ATP-binding cassette domain-containing protein [Elusimicrobia bacterium]|jgi:ABC-2 type transport system ATP-binding protein|nr:ATP-binding cassette domain-containing protein [Elusimicrobiota bacterium]
MTTDAVEIDGLRHDYPPRQRGADPSPALRGITFSVQPGELFGVLGPNGGGKTTLFKILSTALRPTGGRAVLLGHEVAVSPEKVRETIGVVFQSPSLDKKLSVLENLIHQGHLYGLEGETLRRRATDLLARLGVADRSSDGVETLSGGLQRRVEIAKGLLHEPSVLLLDEPTTGLDPGARKDVWTYLSSLTKQGVTVLVTTHLMEEAERCSRLALLDKGLLAALGTPARLKDDIRGDVVTVITTDSDRLIEGVRAQFGVEAKEVDGFVRMDRPDGHRFVPQLVEAFPGLIVSVQVGKPTLEDVFVLHTGHRFWAEQSEVLA